jgi:hypothetical protein
MIEVILHRDLSKAFLSNDTLGREIVVIEDVIRAVVEIVFSKMQALGFVPIW